MGFRVEHPQALIDQIQYGAAFSQQTLRGKGSIPVADYRLATQVPSEGGGSEWADGPATGERACYSFCMCPGGQIVPTSVDPTELCVNGMSFSQRQSQFANAALVVTVEPADFGYNEHGSGAERNPLLGVHWQQEIERRAAIMGTIASRVIILLLHVS